MEYVNAIYDGNAIRFTEPVPVKGQYEVTIIFNKPISDDREVNITHSPIQDEDERQKLMMSIAGSFDDETAKHFYTALEECRQIDFESWK